MRLFLIRHGQTPNNVRGLLDTAVPGPGLTELGFEQAAALPEALGAEPIDALYASSQLRAQLTAAPLAKALGLKVNVRGGVREISAGDLEMLGDTESIERYLSTVFAWSAGELARRMPGGPDGHETFARFDAVIDEVTSNGHRAVAIVSHGAMIRTWVGARAVNLDMRFVAANALSNTGVVVLERDADRRWNALTWMGSAVGGPGLADAATDGPAGDPVLAPDNQ
jgi:broad specificity phosphatase PhoE